MPRSIFSIWYQHWKSWLLSYSRIAAPNSYVKLWVVKLLLLLSHGQALAEGRFSINRQIEADSIVGECWIVCDSGNVLDGVLSVDVSSKKLLISCSSACHKYFTHLEHEKRKKETEASGRKWKALEDEIANCGLKKQKVAVEKDVQSLTKDADEFVVKAEKEHELTLITKSNSKFYIMRCAAKKAKSWQLSVSSWTANCWNWKTAELLTLLPCICITPHV